MLKSGNNTSSKRNLSVKRLLREVKLNKKRKMVGILSLFIISFSLIILITGKTYASCTDLDGYTIGSDLGERRGFTSGAMAVNLAKCTTASCSASTKYATSVITVTPYTTPGQGNNTKALYDNYYDYSRAFKFSSSLSSYVMVGDSPSKGYVSDTADLTDSGDGECFYVAPPMKVKAPKGYRYYSYTAGYPKSLYESNSPVGFFKYNYSTEYDETAFNSSTNGPYANDTWVKGYMNFSLASAGLVTRMTDTTEQYFAIRESANIRFRPNTTTITFNANGGTGTTASKTKTYDATLSIPNSFTRSGYVFNGWNTKADGTGTQYGTSLAKDIWPATTSITLYAQWRDENATCDGTNAPGWEGFTVYQAGSDKTGIGWNDGHFCLNLAKNGVKYASQQINITPSTTGTAASSAMYTTNACYGASSCAQRFTFSDKYSNIGIHAYNPNSNPTAGSKTACGGYESTGFPYLRIPVQFLSLPKGYKYDSYTVGWGSPITSAPYMNIYDSCYYSSSDPLLFNDRPGPYGDGEGASAVIGTSLIPVGLISQNYNNVRYRQFVSGNVNFVPNETTVHYNANGGTLEDEEQDTMEDSTHIYDEESYISPNDYVKEDAIFDKWCTQSNGGGKCYDEDEDVTTAFPTESEVTLYAQWIPKHTATIYYQSSSTNGETDIDTKQVECFGSIQLSATEYRLYGFHNTSTNQDFVYVTDTSGNAVSNFPITIWSEFRGNIIGNGVTDNDGKLRVDTIQNYLEIDDVWVSIDAPYGDEDPDSLYPTNSGTSFSTSGNYLTLSGYTYSVSSCTVTIPTEVKNSVGTYNNSYAGLADSTGTMNTSIDANATTITLSSNKTYFAVYSSNVTNYYYSS